MNNNGIFKTTNRHLEQFLFFHRVSFIAQRKNDDGMNEWIYNITPQLTEVCQEYKRLYPRRFISSENNF